MGIKSPSTMYRNGISVLSCLLIRISGKSTYLISASGTGTGNGARVSYTSRVLKTSGCFFISFFILFLALPFCWITVLVTRTAVSVVICTGPSLRLWNPLSRSSDVRS